MISMTNVSNAILVDTNILVYAHDPRDEQKRGQAVDVLDSLFSNGQAVLSVQCLSEFFYATTRRLPEAMTAEEALVQIERFMNACRVFDLTPNIVLEAGRGVIQHQMSIWDALIWATAKLNQVSFILTEDGVHGRRLEGVRYLNPFDPSFDSGLFTSAE